MEQKQNDSLADEQMLPLGVMREYLKEWSVAGLREEVANIDFEDYDRALSIYDDYTNEHLFYAIFEYGVPITDAAQVYVVGILNEELRGIIKKEIELDAQAEMYRKRDAEKAAQATNAQKGE